MKYTYTPITLQRTLKDEFNNSSFILCKLHLIILIKIKISLNINIGNNRIFIKIKISI